MAILALEGANFLVLDEPTNHLDIPAREALQDVLEEYNGTILLVSHDRYLINRLASVWEIKDRELITFNGNYREYILRRPALPAGRSARKILLKPVPMVRDNSKETRQSTLRLEKLEGRIREKEKEIQTCSRELNKISQKGMFEKMHNISNQMAHAQATLDELLHEWGELVGNPIRNR